MIKAAVKAIVRKLGYELVRPDYESRYADFEAFHRDVVKQVGPYTVTTPERIHALIESVRHCIRNHVEGACVECGVYKGGSMMAVALTLLAEGAANRDLYLFDTFAGMPKPGEKDADLWGNKAQDEFAGLKISDESSRWVNCPLDAVRQAMGSTGYPEARIHYVRGLVENTLPQDAPPHIALLRLDTDWYQSTRHELVHLYPRLSANGVLIIDDYGHFMGAREAVDEYFRGHAIAPYLHRIDYTGRLTVKP